MLAPAPAAGDFADGPAAPALADRLVVHDGRRRWLVPIADVLWLESYGNYTRVCTAERHWLHRATLSSVTMQLAPWGFVRIHRRLTVNVGRVAALRPTGNGACEARLETGHRLRVSRSGRTAFLERLARAHGPGVVPGDGLRPGRTATGVATRAHGI